MIRFVKGFRQALCPFCFGFTDVTSLPDDTRLRYSRHELQRGVICPCSDALVPKVEVRIPSPPPCPACDDLGEITDNGERVSVCTRCGGEA